MDPKTITLIGPVIAAIAGMLIAFMSHRLQMRREHRLWLRNKKEVAYQNSTRYLCKLLVNVSSSTLNDGVLGSMQLASDKPSEEVVEAYIWTNSLAMSCSTQHKSKIEKVAATLLEFAAWRKAEMNIDTISSLYSTVLECAQEDLKK
jgi:hypothetical protein